MSDNDDIKVEGASADVITGVFDDSRAALLREPTAAEMVTVLGKMARRSGAGDKTPPRNEPHDLYFK